MATSKLTTSAHIEPLHMNGLRGRMMQLPPPKTAHKEILLIYGHHASIERYASLAQVLNRYGAVTMPDLPGFGGMQSFYRIGMTPSVDNLADYLAAFIKLRYKHRRLTIVGVSFGFVVVTKMLQKYPQLAARVNLLVSLTGFVHRDDFVLKKRHYYLLRSGTALGSLKTPGWIAHNVLLRPGMLRLMYSLRGIDAASDESQFKINLWRCIDLRTYMKSAHQMFTLDLCDRQVNLPVYHVAAASDQYFDSNIVEQHMRVIFSDFTFIASKLPSHAPPILATPRQVAPLLPPKLRELLRNI